MSYITVVQREKNC